MGREGEKEAQNQHKNRNIKVSFSRQTSRDGVGEEIKNKKQNKTKQNKKKEENKSGKCDGVRGGRGKRQTQAGLSGRRCPGYSSRTKVTASWSVQEMEKTSTQVCLLPSLMVSFSQPPAPTWLYYHPVSSQGPSARPYNTPRFLHTRSPSLPSPVLTRPWEPSGAQNVRVLGR